jgi:hemolysin III
MPPDAPSAGSGYSAAEERAHVATHAVGIVASALALVVLLAAAEARGAGPWRAAGGAIFGLSALLLFSTSVLYHASRSPRLKPRLRLLDHSAIFLLIAGTYTPFALGVLGGAWGWTLFALVWGLAVFGIAAKTVLGFRFHVSSTLLYLAMGWIGVVAAVPLAESLTRAELAWIVAGGLVYTAGVPFYLWKSRPYAHALWHLFVLGGVACHFFAVLSVMSPRGT